MKYSRNPKSGILEAFTDEGKFIGIMSTMGDMVGKQTATDAGWKEEMHKRGANGQFVSMGGGSGTKGELEENNGGFLQNISKTGGGGSIEKKYKNNLHSLKGNDRIIARKMAETISSGKAYHDSSQTKKHVDSTPENMRHVLKIMKGHGKPSIFTRDVKETETEVFEKLKNNDAEFRVLADGTVRAKMQMDKPVGKSFDREDTEGHETNVLTITAKRSKNGTWKWHMYPDD